MNTWRMFYDNLLDRPNKATFTGTSSGTPIAAHDWQRSVDGSRNSTYRIQGIPDATSITWNATWAAPNQPTADGGQWAVGLFNHNLRLAGATSIELQAGTGGPLTQVLDGYFADMPQGPEAGRDYDFVWLSDQTIFTLPITELLLRVRFVTGAALQDIFIGQVMTLGGYFDTDGGALAPVQNQLEALRPLRRTAAGDPSVTPALSQSQSVEMTFPVQSHDQADQYQRLIARQRNALPYVAHTHAVPPAGLWTGPTGSDQDVEGKGMAWMVSPREDSGLVFNTADRYTFRLRGLRQKGLYQWE